MHAPIAASGRPGRDIARPAAPRRIRRSGGSWTDDDLLGAMRAWAGEVGYPPRSYDWSPAAARAAGFPLDGVRKGEREHPHWPHHALVVSRLGSWRAALHAAGLSGLRPLRIERRERVATARRLEASGRPMRSRTCSA